MFTIETRPIARVTLKSATRGRIRATRLRKPRAGSITGNRIAETAGRDEAMLKVEFAALHEDTFDLDLPGLAEPGPFSTATASSRQVADAWRKTNDANTRR